MPEIPILYTTGCPRCAVLKKKLDENGVQYEICGDIDAMQALGIETVPVLLVKNSLMSFPEAVKWANAQKET